MSSYAFNQLERHAVYTFQARVAEQWLARPFALVLGIEHRQDETLPGSEDRRKYGDTVVTFYRAPGDDPATFTHTR